MTIGERIAHFRKTYKIKQQVFAESLDISQSHVSKIENNQDNPSDKLLQKIVAIWGINKEWLLYGKGSITDLDTTLQLDKKQCISAINDYSQKYGAASTSELSELIIKLIDIAETLNFFVSANAFEGISVLNASLDEIQKVARYWTEEYKKNASAVLTAEEGEKLYDELEEITEIYNNNLARTIKNLFIRLTVTMPCFFEYNEKEIEAFLKQQKLKNEE